MAKIKYRSSGLEWPGEKKCCCDPISICGDVFEVGAKTYPPAGVWMSDPIVHEYESTIDPRYTKDIWETLAASGWFDFELPVSYRVDAGDRSMIYPIWRVIDHRGSTVTVGSPYFRNFDFESWKPVRPVEPYNVAPFYQMFRLEIGWNVYRNGSWRQYFCSDPYQSIWVMHKIDTATLRDEKTALILSANSSTPFFPDTVGNEFLYTIRGTFAGGSGNIDIRLRGKDDFQERDPISFQIDSVEFQGYDNTAACQSIPGNDAVAVMFYSDPGPDKIVIYDFTGKEIRRWLQPVRSAWGVEKYATFLDHISPNLRPCWELQIRPPVRNVGTIDMWRQWFFLGDDEIKYVEQGIEPWDANDGIDPVNPRRFYRLTSMSVFKGDRDRPPNIRIVKSWYDDIYFGSFTQRQFDENNLGVIYDESFVRTETVGRELRYIMLIPRRGASRDYSPYEFQVYSHTGDLKLDSLETYRQYEYDFRNIDYPTMLALDKVVESTDIDNGWVPADSEGSTEGNPVNVGIPGSPDYRMIRLGKWISETLPRPQRFTAVAYPTAGFVFKTEGVAPENRQRTAVQIKDDHTLARGFVRRDIFTSSQYLVYQDEVYTMNITLPDP